MSTAQFFIGVDGGATRCRARLRAASGRALAEETGPAANIYVDFDAGLGVIARTRRSGDRQGRARPESRGEMALGVGLAGLSSAQDAARVAAALPGWARVEAVNDAVTACVGANGVERRRTDHRRHRHGGHRPRRRRREDRRRPRFPARRRRIRRPHRRRRHARGDARVRRSGADERPVARLARPISMPIRCAMMHWAHRRQARRLRRLRAAGVRGRARRRSLARARSSGAPRARSSRSRARV